MDEMTIRDIYEVKMAFFRYELTRIPVEDDTFYSLFEAAAKMQLEITLAMMDQTIRLIIKELEEHSETPLQS